MAILIRVNNDEECVLVQKLLNTFGYSWPMGDDGVYTIGELINEYIYDVHDFNGSLIIETDKYRRYHWGTPDEMPGNILSFEEFLNEIENNGGNI
jgi:hypothetical protein